MSVKYTGRRIAIISGCYGLIEPLEAIFNDIKHLGITEIYSLGNNIGYGPDSSVVIDMIEYAGIKSVVGEFEKYCILGDMERAGRRAQLDRHSRGVLRNVRGGGNAP